MDHGGDLVGEPTDEATAQDGTRGRAQTLPLTPAGNVDADGDECIATDDPPIDPVLASALEQLVVTPKRPLSETLFEMRGR
ncbi:hypothetical protein pdul_cds_155 [Pandoravirus dulcis]|uniref:Uncharacterized protein n=1 Tax=Pandoravirus dulcis TaxID=1349409 RepID=S4VVG1_9VIRU|nr:hypothetical protein pdul_cds_155 [Pandoravirus dulcis]AGO82076.2 hypothetical protein pdul_cds_155 [Pandoravirus dulcis]